MCSAMGSSSRWRKSRGHETCVLEGSRWADVPGNGKCQGAVFVCENQDHVLHADGPGHSPLSLRGVALGSCGQRGACWPRHQSTSITELQLGWSPGPFPGWRCVGMTSRSHSSRCLGRRLGTGGPCAQRLWEVTWKGVAGLGTQQASHHPFILSFNRYLLRVCNAPLCILYADLC